MNSYFSFQWHITDECDQRCKHCYIYSSGKHEKKLVPSSGRVYDFKNIRDAVIAQDNGAVNGKIVVIM